MTAKRPLNLPILAILLIGAITRFAPIASVPMWWDEVWSMWQTQGSFAQTLALTPYDWPPLYYLLLRAWTYLVGPNDVTGRVLSVLFALIGIAFLYRAGRAIGGLWAGLFAGLILAVLPYSVYLSMEARGYALLMLLAPALAWLHVRWLRRPDWRRSILYAVTLALCLYTSYTGVLLIGLALVHGLVVVVLRPHPLAPSPSGGRGIKPRNGIFKPLSLRERGWGEGFRAWLAALILLIVLSLPLAPRLAVLVGIRKGNIEQRLAPPGIDQVLPNFYGWLAGKQPELMAVLIGLTLIGLILWLRSRPTQRTITDLAFILLWSVAAPLLMYIFRYQLLLVATRYLLYIVPGIALAMGFGFSRFPRAIKPLLIFPVLLYVIAPLPVENYRPALSDEKPIRDIVRELGRRYQPGDQVLIDPNCNCGRPVEWSYYEEIYYPGGQISRVTIDQPLARRVWYVSDQRSQAPNIIERLRGHRTESEYFGPYYMIATLWEAPPSLDPSLTLGDEMTFIGSDVRTRQPLHAGDALTVRLWWLNGDHTPRTQYSVTLSVISSSGQIIVQNSEALQTDDWQPYSVHLNEQTLLLPPKLQEGSYTLQIDVNGSQSLTIGSVYLFNYYVQ